MSKEIIMRKVIKNGRLLLEATLVTSGFVVIALIVPAAVVYSVL